MKRFFWRLRYTLVMWDRLGYSWPMRFCWQCSEAGWDIQLDFPMTPSEAVAGELECWSE